MAKILLIEDDSDLSQGLKAWLSKENHIVEICPDGAKALELLEDFKYDLIVLDVNLPGLNGFEVLRRYRARRGATPIIMLTSKSAVQDKELGLDSGADDYLTKPFDPRELSARVRTQLRRTAAQPSNILTAGDITLDPASLTIKCKDKDIRVQPKEFALLEFFMRHPNQVFSLQALLERVWPSDSEVSPESLRVYVAYLRSKIDSADQPSYIQTVHRVGYKFVPPTPAQPADA